MSSEVLLMNKRGIVLASDSIAQINRDIIYSKNAKKIFSIKDNFAIMIYGSSEYMGVPFEIIIDNYEKKEKEDFQYFKDFYIDFINYLKSNCCNTNNYEKFYVRCYLNYLLKDIKKEYLYANNKIALIDILLKKERELKKSQKLEISKSKEKKVIIKYRAVVKHFISEVFKKIEIGEEETKLLCNIIFQYFIRENFHFSHIGMVLVGYGKNEHFPMGISLLLEGKFEQILKYKIIEKLEINDNIDFIINSFAAKENILGFINGITPNLKKKIYDIIFLNIKDDKVLTFKNIYNEVEQIICTQYTNNKITNISKFRIKDMIELAVDLINIEIVNNRISSNDTYLLIDYPIQVMQVTKHGYIKTHIFSK